MGLGSNAASTFALGNVSTFVGAFTDANRALLTSIGRSLIIGVAVRDDTDGINAYPTLLTDNRQTVTASNHAMAIATGFVAIADQDANTAIGSFGGPSIEEWAISRHGF
jgi:hypothetical protein